MSPEDSGRIAAWLAATDIGLLELRGPGTALRLRQEGGGVTVDAIETEAAETFTANAASVGVFLHRHPLRTEDLAAPGTGLAAGQVLGLLQTGPLLLPVPAPAAGVLVQWLVPHGSAVGYGTPLAALQAG